MEKRLIFRLPDRLYEQVNDAVRRGEANNVSELIRQALLEFLGENFTDNPIITETTNKDCSRARTRNPHMPIQFGEDKGG